MFIIIENGDIVMIHLISQIGVNNVGYIIAGILNVKAIGTILELCINSFREVRERWKVEYNAIDVNDI